MRLSRSFLKTIRGATEMVRILNILAIAALIGSAIYAYSIKYDTIFSRRDDREASA